MKFEEIVGKSTLKSQLLKRVHNNKVPHAQLFVGPSGSGNLAMALAFIQYIFCENPTETDSCGACKSCAKAEKHIHPDIHYSFPVIPKKSGSKPVSNDYMEEWREALLEDSHMNYLDWMLRIGAENKQGNITKEECKSIIQKLSLKAFEGKYKALVMWLPEHLGKEGNSLLKLIEEPPKDTYFILVSENPDAILPTILSRTQLVKVDAYTREEIKAYLSSLDAEVDPESVAFLADGDLNEAKKLVDHSDNSLNEDFKAWMRHCFRRDVPKLMQWSDDMGGRGRENIKNFLQYSLGILREVLAYKTVPNYVVRMGEGEQQFVSNFSSVIQFANIEVLYEGLNDCIGHIERNANPKLTLFQLSLAFRDSFIETQKANKV